jgi:hypothetical protein
MRYRPGGAGFKQSLSSVVEQIAHLRRRFTDGSACQADGSESQVDGSFITLRPRSRVWFRAEGRSRKEIGISVGMRLASEHSISQLRAFERSGFSLIMIEFHLFSQRISHFKRIRFDSGRVWSDCPIIFPLHLRSVLSESTLKRRRGDGFFFRWTELPPGL